MVPHRNQLIVRLVSRQQRKEIDLHFESTLCQNSPSHPVCNGWEGLLLFFRHETALCRYIRIKKERSKKICHTVWWFLAANPCQYANAKRPLARLRVRGTTC